MSKMKKMFKLGGGKKHVDPSEWTKNDDKLVAAIQANDLEKVEQLMVKKGVTPTKLNQQGITALHIAALEGRLNILRLFQEREVDLTTLDYHGKTPLLCACKGGHLDVIRYLLQINPETLTSVDHHNLSPMHHACLGGSLDATRHLLKAGASVIAKDKVGRSPLFISAQFGNLDMCKDLLDSGCDINHRDFDKMTPLMFAVENQHTQVVEYLVRRGANVLLTDAGGRNASSYAKQTENQDIVRILENAPSRASWNIDNIKEDIKEELIEVTIVDEADMVEKFEPLEDEKPSPLRRLAAPIPPIAPARKPKQAPPPPPGRGAAPGPPGRDALSPPPGFGSPVREQTPDQKYEQGIVPMDEALESDAATLNDSVVPEMDPPVDVSQTSGYFSEPPSTHTEGYSREMDSPTFSPEALAAVEAIMESTSTPPGEHTSHTPPGGLQMNQDEELIIDVEAYKELEEEHEFLNRELQQVSVEKKQLEEKVLVLERRLSSSDNEGPITPITAPIQSMIDSTLVECLEEELNEARIQIADDKEKMSELKEDVRQLRKQIDIESKPEAERGADDSWDDSDDDLFESEVDNKKKSSRGAVDIAVIASLRSQVLALKHEIEEIKPQTRIADAPEISILSESATDRDLESLTQYSMLQQAHDSECQQLQTRIEGLLEENFVIKKELEETVEEKMDLTAAIEDVDMKAEDAARSKTYVQQELDYIHGVIEAMQSTSEMPSELDQIKDSIESAQIKIGLSHTFSSGQQNNNEFFEQLRHERDQLKQALEKSKRENERINAEFSEILSQVQGLEGLAVFNTELTQENDRLNEEIDRLKSMGSSSPRDAEQKAMAMLTMQLQQENNDLLSENRSLNSKISDIETSLKETIAQKGQERLQASPYEQENDSMKKIEFLQHTIMQQTEELLKAESDLPPGLNELRSQITHLKKTVSQQDETIMELMQQSTSDAQLRYDYEQLQSESELMGTRMLEFQALFTGQNEESSTQIQALQQEIQNLQTENSDLKAVPPSQVISSTADTEALESQIASLNKKLRNVDDEKKQLEAQLSQSEVDLLKIKKDADKAVFLKKENDALEEERLQLEIQVAQLSAASLNADTSSQRASDLEKENAELVEGTDKLSQEITKLIEEKDLLANDHMLVLQERDELLQDIPKLRDDLSKLEAQRSVVSTMEATLDKLHQENNTLMQDNESLEEKVYELESKGNNNEPDYFALQSKIKELNEQLEREQNATVMTILDGRTAEQQSTESGLKEQLLSLTKENEDLRTQIEQLQPAHQNGTTDEVVMLSTFSLQSSSPGWSSPYSNLPRSSSPESNLGSSLKKRSEEFRFKEMEEENDRLKTEIEKMKLLPYGETQGEAMTKQLLMMQEKLEMMEKRHRDVITTYRAHLLRAVRGHMDTEVQQALMHIIKIRQAPEVDV